MLIVGYTIDELSFGMPNFLGDGRFSAQSAIGAVKARHGRKPWNFRIKKAGCERQGLTRGGPRRHGDNAAQQI